MQDFTSGNWSIIFSLMMHFLVESKGSNQGLLDAVSDLEMKSDNTYYIAFDYVVDNQDVRNKYRMLRSIAGKSEGKIIILDIVLNT